jgi:serine/threonine protein kinase
MTFPSPAQKRNPREETSPRAAGEKVGRYEIVRLVGRGSMGAVYLASDPLIGREVALKTLSTSFSIGKEELQRLRSQYLNEARSAGGLGHPGIVTVYDVIEEQTGRISIAMEYVRGPTLRERLRDPEPLALETVADVISQIAEVLDYAHSQGVVHRDIKPANIILSKNGQAKVADFGIAALRGSDLARELKALGTPNYLAPERFLDLEVDGRADIYSMGVVLYEMLTRHLPFQGETMGELAKSIVQDEFIPLEIHRPDLPQELRELFCRALAKEPSARFQTAGELAASVRSIVEKQAKLNDTVVAIGAEKADLSPPVDKRPRAKRMASRLGALGRRAAQTLLSPLSVVFARPLTPVRMAVLALVVTISVLGLLSLSGHGETVLTVDEVNAASEEQRRLAEYTALLHKGETLLRAGEFEAVEGLLQEAEGLSAEAASIGRIRDEARRRKQARREAERQAEIRANLDEARAAFEQRDLATADAAVSALLEIDPGHEAGLVLAAAIGGIRESLRRPVPPAVELPEEEQPPAVETPVAEEPPPTAAFETFSPVVERAPVVEETFGTLRIDFQSQVPRGVLTLYSGQEQILRRSFRFVEKRGFLRRRGVSGGFDSQVRLARGTHELRAYLSIPGRETQTKNLSGNLAGGSIRTLRVRVSAEGELQIDFY